MKLFADPLFVVEEIPIRKEVVRKYKVKSVTGRYFSIEGDIQSPRGFKSCLLQYDINGNKIGQQKYSRTLEKVYEWIYDPRGRVRREIGYANPNKVCFRFEYIYNNGENWYEKRMYYGSESISYVVIANRDDHGRIIEGTYYDTSDHIIRKDSYAYDEQGRLTQISMGQMGELTYEYDERNNLRAKNEDLMSENALGNNFIFQYDDRGLLLKKKHIHCGVTMFEYTFFG